MNETNQEDKLATQLVFLDDEWVKSKGIGRTVRLRSGGPPMTLVSVPEEGIREVIWFTGGLLKRDFLPANCLFPES